MILELPEPWGEGQPCVLLSQRVSVQAWSHSTNNPPSCVAHFWATGALQLSFHLHEFQTHPGDCSFVNHVVAVGRWDRSSQVWVTAGTLCVPFNPGPACSSCATAGALFQCSLDSIGRKVSPGCVDAIVPAGTAEEACTQVGQPPVDSFVADGALLWCGSGVVGMAAGS